MLHSQLPPPVQVPTTPAVQAKDITTIYELNENSQKGTGAFSRVIVGRHIESGALRAIKIMEKQHLVGKKAEMVAHEKEILRRARHPSIVHMYDCIQTPERVYFALDLMQTDLFEYVVQRKKLSEEDTRKIMRQLLEAVKYLHDQSVVHRDIKPENILINTPDDIKLADFGLAKVVQEWDVRSTPCGTSFYIAPEIIRGIEAQGARPLCTTRESVKSIDLWSCGVVMFVLIAGRPPFAGQVKTSVERKTLLQKIDRGVLFPDAQWISVSEEAKDLVMGLLNQDIKQRITAAKALLHPFFTGKAESTPEAPAEMASLEKAVASATIDATHAPATAVAPVDAPRRELTDDQKQIISDINALQEELVETGDADGDKSSYTATVVRALESGSQPDKKMNPNAKIGAHALKK